MLKVKEKNFKYVNTKADYRLENDILLFADDWNGEIYNGGLDLKTGEIVKNEYKPIYNYEIKNIDIFSVEENSDEWNHLMEIVGFED